MRIQIHFPAARLLHARPRMSTGPPTKSNSAYGFEVLDIVAIARPANLHVYTYTVSLA